MMHAAQNACWSAGVVPSATLETLDGRLIIIGEAFLISRRLEVTSEYAELSLAVCALGSHSPPAHGTSLLGALTPHECLFPATL